MIIIRKAKKTDIPEIEKLDKFGRQLNSYSGLDKLDLQVKEEPGKTYYDKFLRGQKKWMYVAESDAKISGFILFNIEKREIYFKIKKIGYIDLVYVDNKKRGKGISKMLLEKAKDILKEEGIKYVKLSVHSDNFTARKAWKKQGFKEYRIDMFKKLR